MRFGLVGETYTAQSPKFANERAINLYCEPIESPNPGKGGSRMMMVKIPGLATTHTLPDTPLHCLFSGDSERVFAVSGSTLYELFQDGTFTALGNVASNSLPAQIFANGTQLLVISGGKAYMHDGVTLTKVLDSSCQGGYLGGYGLSVDGALPGESKTFRLSGFEDFGSWDVLDFANVDQSPDNIQALVVDHLQAIFLKQQTGAFFWNEGDPDFPIVPVVNSFLEQGCVAPFSAVRIDNTVMWMGGDERGAGIVWRMQGATPTRVSNFAVENAIQGYVRAGHVISDAVAFAMQDQGHTFYVLSFPDADATWVYDCATGLWHERLSWDVTTATWHAHKARFHCYAWGKHLVGGGDATGKVYDQSISYQDDAGDVLRWLRRAPHISDSRGFKTFYSNLFIDFQVGVGTLAVPYPTVMVRHSNDGGYTWGPEEQLPLGALGQYYARVRQTLCGSGYDRNIEVSGSDSVVTAIVGADIQAEAGTS